MNRPDESVLKQKRTQINSSASSSYSSYDQVTDPDTSVVDGDTKKPSEVKEITDGKKDGENPAQDQSKADGQPPHKGSPAMTWNIGFYHLHCSETGTASVFLDMPQMSCQTLLAHGLLWLLFDRNDGKLVTPVATGIMFEWFYTHFIYNNMAVRSLPLSQLAIAADLMDAHIFPPTDKPRERLLRDVLRCVKKIARKMQESKTTQALHSARVMDFMIHGTAKYRTRSSALSAQLSKDEVRYLLGNPKYYRRKIDLVTHKYHLQPPRFLMPRNHKEFWQNRNVDNTPRLPESGAGAEVRTGAEVGAGATVESV